mgnify:FL=1
MQNTVHSGDGQLLQKYLLAESNQFLTTYRKSDYKLPKYFYPYFILIPKQLNL